MQVQVTSDAQRQPLPAAKARGTRRLLHWLPLLAVGVVLVVCAVLLLQPKSSASSTATLAPDFTLPAVLNASGQVSLHSLRGRPVVINFFNSHCVPCLEELPELRKAALYYGAKGVTFLGVATGGDTLQSARALASAARLPYRIVVDPQQAVDWRYYVGGWPTTFFLDAQGRMQAEYVGQIDEGTLRSGLAQAGAIHCANCTPLPQASLVTDQPAAGAAPSIDADTVYTPPQAAPPFALRDQQGRLVTPQSLRGKIVALTFISSVCKEQCPLVGKALTLVRGELGRDANKLTIVAISVDPEQDSAKATQAFASASGWQGTDWHYLSASRAVLSPIWKQYGVYVENLPPIFQQGQSIQHQAQVFLIDQHGKLRAYYDVPFLPARVVDTIKALL